VEPAKYFQNIFVNLSKFIFFVSRATNLEDFAPKSFSFKVPGIEIELGDTFHADKHKDLKVDYIMANPPFNVSDWGGESLQDSKIWEFGIPPVGNANYAWLQLFLKKLNPNGTAGIVLANGSMTTTSGTENQIREKLVKNSLVDWSGKVFIDFEQTGVTIQAVELENNSVNAIYTPECLSQPY
jgi:hypothetical protein